MVSKPELLDLYCCEGGATRGYQKWFKVTGVDIVRRSRYCGDRFLRSDAISFLERNASIIRRRYKAIHASPPCQLYSKTHRINLYEHPDLIAPTRDALEAIGLPYVIENVEDARTELRDPVTLCGAMFGLRTYRHRLFEAGGGLVLPQPKHRAHVVPNAKMGRPILAGQFYHAVGHFSDVDFVRFDMGMPWASREGLSEAVPPAYAEWIGERIAKLVGV